MNNRTIRIIAACVIACMFVIVPSSWGTNGSSFDFAYRFIWDLGPDEKSAIPRNIESLHLLVQIIGVLAITWLLTKNRS